MTTPPVPEAPPVPEVPPTPEVPPVKTAAAPRKKRAYKKRTPKEPETTIVNVRLKGRFSGVHALDPSIRFFPGTITQVPNDPWVKAQISAGYLELL